MHILLILLLVGESFLFLARFNWIFELFTHYIVYYVFLEFFLILFFFRKKFAYSLIILGFFSAHIAQIMPYYQDQTHLQNSGQEIKVFTNNFYYLNEDFETIKEVIEAENPDIFTLQETNLPWLTEKDYYKNSYPYMKITEDNFGPFGMLLASKYPAEITEMNMQLDGGTYTWLEAMVDKNGEKFRVLAVHPMAPESSTWTADRNTYLMELAKQINSSDLPTIVLGDFNSAPWSPYFKELIIQTNLKEARKGYGILATWNANHPYFWIPIDHILTTPNIQILDFHRGDYTSSDHYPVVASLRLP